MTDEARFSSDPPPLAGYRIRLAACRVRRGAGRARVPQGEYVGKSCPHLLLHHQLCIRPLCLQRFIE